MSHRESPEHVPDPDLAPPPASQRRPVEALVLGDGTRAVVEDDGIAIRDAKGRLLVRYADGAATIEAASGDLRLSAPSGRVTIDAAEDIVLEAGRELRQRAQRAVLAADDVEVVARAIVTSAERISETASRVERTAHRLIERAHDAFRDVTELSQSRLGRVRTLVRETYSLHTGRTTLVSKDDTSIDGNRILLG